MQRELEKEQENLKKRHSEVLNNLQKEFENEKYLRQQKIDIQVSKYMKSGQSFGEMNENDEKKEIAVVFNLTYFYKIFSKTISISFFSDQIDLF